MLWKSPLKIQWCWLNQKNISHLLQAKEQRKNKENRKASHLQSVFFSALVLQRGSKKKKKKKKNNIFYIRLSAHIVFVSEKQGTKRTRILFTLFSLSCFLRVLSLCPVGILTRKQNKIITIVLIQSESFFSPKVSSWESSEIIYLASCPYLILPEAILGIQGYPLALFLLCTEPQVFISWTDNLSKKTSLCLMKCLSLAILLFSSGCFRH